MKKTTFHVQSIIAKMKSHKFFLLACLCAGSVAATAYLYVHPAKYEAKATLRPVDNQQMQNSTTAATDAEVLQSRKMIERAVSDQAFNVVYTKTRPMQQRELYGNAPFEVKYSIQDKNFSMQNFDIALLSNESYSLNYDAGSVPMQREGSFGKELDLGFVKLNISRTPYAASSSDLDKYHFAVYSNSALAQRISNENFTCKPVNNTANVVEISYQNENPAKAYQVVNAVAQAYGKSETASNEELIRANVEQINNQLIRVSQELDNSQAEIAAYKSENNAFELPQQAGATLNTVSQLQVQKVDVDMQLAALDNMSDYLRKNRNVNSISPEYGTINDLVYTETYLKLTDKAAERQQLKEAGGDVSKLDREINGLKDMLAESMRNTRKKLTVKQQAMADAIVVAKGRMENMPEAENRLQQLNRNVYLYTKLYDFLIQKRAEAMVSAPVIPTASYIVDEASFPTSPVTPNEAEVWSIALLASLLGGLVIIAVRPMLKTRIRNREDLQQYTDIPFIANIDNSKKEEYLSEPFMNLCTKILLMDQEKQVKMVTLTSTHSGEGKTTIAQNLAKTYASLDKKVLLVDMNPVNPGLEVVFDVQNDNSIANIYNEEANLHQAVSLTTVPNVDLLKAGQLKNGINTFLTSGKTGSIIADIKELYDLVIFDTPETSNYIDAIPLMKASDLNLYVVKSNTASASYVKQASLIKNDFGIDNMYIVLNGMTENKNHSGIETTGRFKVLKGRQQAEAEVRLIPRMLKKAALWFY